MHTKLFAALDDDWALLSSTARARRHVGAWHTDPVLRQITNLDELISTLRNGADDPESTDQLLAALARRAPTDEIAARTLLQALLPGLINVAKRVGHGRIDDELAADVVEEAVARIRTYPIDRRPRYIAANVTWDVFGRITRQRRRAIAPAVNTFPVATPAPDIDPSEEVCELVSDALRTGKLRALDAQLLLAIAVGNDTIGRRAAREGITYDAMCERWRRARNRLRLAAVA
jgi:hypothetical protein